MEPHDANGLEPRIRGHDQVSAEAAEEAIGKDQYAPLTQPLSCEAVGTSPRIRLRDASARCLGFHCRFRRGPDSEILCPLGTSGIPYQG